MAAEAAGTRRVLLALGGNVGDVAHGFRTALAGLAALGVHPTCTSRLYVTEAQLAPGAAPQPRYLNAVVAASTALPPAAVLAALQRLERAAGPRGAGRWAARRLDLDYLADENFVQRQGALTLPHPRAHQRTFVLAPAADVAPHWPLGGRQTPVSALLRASVAAGGGAFWATLSWASDPRGPVAT